MLTKSYKTVHFFVNMHNEMYKNDEYLNGMNECLHNMINGFYQKVC